MPVHHFSLFGRLDIGLAGAVAEQFSDFDRALAAYEHALRHNPGSVSALTQVAGIARAKEDFPKVSVCVQSGSREEPHVR